MNPQCVISRFRHLLCITAIIVVTATAHAENLPVPTGWHTASTGSDSWHIEPNDANGNFSMDVGPIQVVTTPAEKWFTTRFNQGVKQRNARVTQATQHDTRSGLYSAVAVQAGDTSQPRLILFYGIFDGGERHGRMILITAKNLAQAKQYIKPAGNIVGKLAVAMRKGRANTNTRVTSTAKTKEDKRDSRKNWKPIAESGQGLKASDIDKVMYEGRGITTVYGYQYKETVLLLLKDGSVYTNLELPPTDLDVAASRDREKDKWSQWRKRFGTYQIKNSKGEWIDRKIREVEPLPSGNRLDKSLIHRASYIVGGMGGSIFTQTISFKRDGTFERSRSATGSTGVIQSTSGFSGSVSSHSDKQGSSTVTASSSEFADNRVGVSGRNKTGGNGEFSGQYKVEGYTLELKTDAGTTERYLAFYPFDNTDKIFIGGATYDKPK